MKQRWKKFRYKIEYIAVLAVCGLIRILPHGGVRAISRFFGWGLWLVPSAKKLVLVNLRVAFPDKSADEIRRIGKESLFHLIFNLIEFIWFDGRPERVKEWCRFDIATEELLDGLISQGIRCIFVNPHLGSWEASAAIGSLDTGIKMAAVAKKIRNPHLDKLYNSGHREKHGSVKVIFSNGAVRASIKALRDGYNIGILIDQNTVIRAGGVFVDFFGLPCLSSTSPAIMQRYCQTHDVSSCIVCGATIRMPDGKLETRTSLLPKPFDEYRSDREVATDLIRWGEELARKYPEQYLWFYKRFQYIDPDAPDEVKKRYPDYAHIASK